MRKRRSPSTWKRPGPCWRSACCSRLGEVIGADGQVLSTQYSARVHSGMLEVTLTAECREEIGTEVPGGREIPGENPVE